MSNSATNITLDCLVILIQIVAIVLASLALSGTTWIEGVYQEGSFFTRVQYSKGYSGYFNPGPQCQSFGLWRYVGNSGRGSSPLPIRDPEVLIGTTCFTLALVFGCLCIVLVSYQMFGVTKHHRLAAPVVALAAFWTVFFQAVMLLTATTVVLNYFKHTFRYERLGHSHHMAWISFSFSCLALLLAVIRVVIQATSPEHHYSRHHNEAVTYGGGQGGRGGGSEYSQPRGGYNESRNHIKSNNLRHEDNDCIAT